MLHGIMISNTPSSTSPFIGQRAPVGISTYARLPHLQKTVCALLQNTLASETDVYVFSDGPKPGDEAQVSRIREFLASVSGFKNFTVIERASNDRVFNNRDGVRQLLEDYGRIIFLEEDIVTAPGFLRFMNEALDFYKDNSNVLSVSGYALPLPWKTDSDVFTLSRFCGWGVGITRENFERIGDVPLDALKSLNLRKLERMGPDIRGMLNQEIGRKISALDVCAMYLQCTEGLLTVFPRLSLVQNTGHDGTGVHCGQTDKFMHQDLWQKTAGFKFPEETAMDEVNVRMHYLFRAGPWRMRFKRRWKRVKNYLRGR